MRILRLATRLDSFGTLLSLIALYFLSKRVFNCKFNSKIDSEMRRKSQNEQRSCDDMISLSIEKI